MKSHAMPAVDPGEGPGHSPPPPYFYSKLRPEGPNKIFFGDWTPILYLRVWMTAPPPPFLTEGLDLPLHARATIKETA